MKQHGANFLKPPPKVIEGAEEYEVEAILGYQVYGQWKKMTRSYKRSVG